MKQIAAFAVAALMMLALSVTAFADNGRLTLDEAKEIALEYAGVTGTEDVTFTKVRKDWDDGRYVYEIEFYTEGTEYEMDVDMETGRITDFSTKFYGDPVSRSKKASDGMLTEEEALAKALERAGVKEENVDFVRKITRDFEHGIEVYEVEFYCGGFEYSVDVNVRNGRIVSFEKDRD
jgi:uncharacterized membrane protein YkoI